MNWDDLKFFLAVAQEGSARAAAAKLGIHHSTITRRIEAFESTQKTRLFDRLPSGYTLTKTGKELLQAAIRIEDEINGIERHILGQDIRLQGDIRVTMPEHLALNLLMPDMVRFMEIYPDVNLKLVISCDMLSLSKREADVAIRVTNNPPEHLVGRKVIRYHCATYASSHYLETHELTTEKAHWIGWDSPTPYPDWVKQSEFPHLSIRGQIASILAQLAAAKEGLGLARLPCFVGDSDSRLQRVPPGRSVPCHDIWVLTHKDLVSTMRIQTFIDFITDAFRHKRDVLEGRKGLIQQGCQ
ncbi:LysR family transcriptional regulator [Leptothoe spongobia]|uniref:LysR family transcriptional regulator n=1 Tax=Leptothoe spongobia TAU-MAC 1115 TaxID=1967444 RepID=A0A947DMP7_9CYAN|nr:LysR family transcriptional regulator [Leptothoe spongobia]MBT9317811.1 LysR family transcriptional regulator [Leptothoe spongobia TAU-MAC 1115]